MSEPWEQFALREILASPRRLTPWEKEFIHGDPKNPAKPGVKNMIEHGVSLSEKRLETLVKIHQKMTDLKRSA